MISLDTHNLIPSQPIRSVVTQISVVQNSDSAATTSSATARHPTTTSTNDATSTTAPTSTSGCRIPSALEARQISTTTETNPKWFQKEAKGASDRFVH